MLFAALIHSLVVKNLTSRLHSSTFWEQLHTTVRQENILKKLAGPPIRPRPRPAKGQGKAWKLVRGALQKKKERQKKKDGSDNLVHDQGGGVTAERNAHHDHDQSSRSSDDERDGSASDGSVEVLSLIHI